MAALAAAFMLGGGRGDDNESAQAAAPATSVAPTQPASPGAPAPARDMDGSEGGDADAADATATATASATATATPSGDGCAVCVDGGFAAEPTPFNPCPLCDKPVFGAQPADTTAPVIDDISHVELCDQTLYVDFTVSEPAKVWLSYVYNGVTVNAPIAHVTDDAHLAVDLSDYGWGVVLIDSYKLHAEDYSGNAATDGPHDMPDLEIGC